MTLVSTQYHYICCFTVCHSLYLLRAKLYAHLRQDSLFITLLATIAATIKLHITGRHNYQAFSTSCFSSLWPKHDDLCISLFSFFKFEFSCLKAKVFNSCQDLFPTIHAAIVANLITWAKHQNLLSAFVMLRKVFSFWPLSVCKESNIRSVRFANASSVSPSLMGMKVGEIRNSLSPRCDNQVFYNYAETLHRISLLTCSLMYGGN